jgi:hypothetical protein
MESQVQIEGNHQSIMDPKKRKLNLRSSSDLAEIKDMIYEIKEDFKAVVPTTANQKG